MGKSEAVDIDMSVEIDGEVRRGVLTIQRSPTLFDWKRLAYRLLLAECERMTNSCRAKIEAVKHDLLTGAVHEQEGARPSKWD